METKGQHYRPIKFVIYMISKRFEEHVMFFSYLCWNGGYEEIDKHRYIHMIRDVQEEIYTYIFLYWYTNKLHSKSICIIGYTKLCWLTAQFFRQKHKNSITYIIKVTNTADGSPIMQHLVRSLCLHHISSSHYLHGFVHFVHERVVQVVHGCNKMTFPTLAIKIDTKKQLLVS